MMDKFLFMVKHVEESTHYNSQKIIGSKKTHITMSWAQTMDGVMGDDGPIQISSSTAMEMTHGMRSMHDGIIVGINTVILDNPKLNCRTNLGTVKHPQVIVMDSSGRIPMDSYLMQNSNPIIVYQNDNANIQKLKAKEIRCWHCPNLQALIDQLFEFGIKSAMVEGGPTVLRSFLPFSDLFVVTIGKKLIGKGKRIDIELDLVDSTVLNWKDELVIIKQSGSIE